MAVQREGPKGKETVGEILPISIFGEVAVIEDIRRTADVVTQEPCVILEIPAQVIRETSAESQYIREINDFKNAIMVAQYFASAPMFRNLPEDIVQLFLNFGKIEAIKESEVIFYQGSRGDGFYLLIRGAVGVIINGIQVKKIQQGGFFGETSVIADIPRTATVTALENTLLLRISNDAFWEIITQNIEMAMFIESVSEMRIMEDIELLNRGIPQQGQMVG
jgi:CRP-like cAMP-binding protein